MRAWQSGTGLGGRLLGGAPGEPPRTLLLHGFTGSAPDWLGCAARLGPALALDLPGHGSSADPRGDWDTAIAGLLAALPPSIRRVVGYSLGGRIALGMLRAAPRRFDALTILSAHPGLVDPLARAERHAADRRWIELLRRDGMASFVAAWEAQPLFATQARLPARARARQRARRLRQRAEGLAASLETFGLGQMPDTRAALRDFDGAVQWIVGAEDRRFVEIARQVAQGRPGLEPRLLAGVGHNLPLEAPRALAALIGRSARQRPPAGAPGA